MLSEIRRYLTERGRAPLSDIALRLGVPPDAARAMLEQWMRKGRVCRADAAACGGGCAKGCGHCPQSAASEIYQWVA